MKKIKVLLGLAVAIAGITAFSTTEAHASSYTITKTKTYTNRFIYHAKSTTKNAYIWNKTHTKKLHNLKNYPNTTWVGNYSVVMKHNGKSALYFNVAANTPNNKKNVTGYVWHSYLTKGYNRNYSHWNNLWLDGFTSDADYLSYINKSNSQSLTKNVLNLFPNSHLSLNLSRYVETPSKLVDNAASFNNSFSGKIMLSDVNQEFLHQSGDTTTTDADRLQSIKQDLEDNGYNAQKRATLKDYDIGIFYQNTNKYYNDDNSVGLIIAKSVN